MTRLWIALLITATLPAPLIAAPAASPAAAPLAGAEAFLDEKTFAVAAIDVAAINPEALLAWSVALLKDASLPQNQIDGVTYGLRGLIPPAKKWTGDFARAGARTVFLVISTDPQTPALVIAPLESRSNIPAMAELLKSPLGIKLPSGFIPPPGTKAPAVKPPTGTAKPPAGAAAPPPGTPFGFHVDRIGNALVLGEARGLIKARAMAERKDRAPRPELAAALTGTTGSIRIGLALTEDLRKSLAAFGPTLPAELGGEPTNVITEKLKWAAITVDLPAAAQPKAAIHLTLQAADSDSAGRLKNILAALVRTAVNDGDLAKHPDKEKFQKMLEAKVAGERAVVDIDQANLKASAGILGPLAIQANAKVARATSETHLKQIVTAIRNYSEEFNGRMPKSLEDPQLLKYLGDTPAQAKDVLTNPADPGRGLGYVYVRPANGNRPLVPQTVVLVYEAYDRWPAGGIQAGFADGHVAEIKTEADLKAQR
jgi:prepilin-type processing-associated H-X9-DG protein